MATHEERIQRMEQQGILSASQAENLLESLQCKQDSGDPAEVRGLPAGLKWLLIFSLVFVAGVIFLVLFSSGTNVVEIQKVADTMNQTGNTGSMPTYIAAAITFALLVIVPVVGWLVLFNGLVSKEERVLSSWAQVESNYQRRSDLIPSLVESISRYIKHEQETLTDVTEARSDSSSPISGTLSRLLDAQKDSAKILNALGGKPPVSDESLIALTKAQETLGTNMHRLFAVAEDYPELRSSEQFVQLQSQLEGAENRINIARIRFNEDVRVFNEGIRKVPASIVADLSGFKRKAYFAADDSARERKPLNFPEP